MHQIGWGREGDVEMKLTQIDVAIRSLEYCNFILNKAKEEGRGQIPLQIKLFLPELLIPSQFCADQTTLSEGVKTTFGDSGGPSVRRYETVQNRFEKLIFND